MQVRVYKGNVTKAIAILNKKLREDGDNRRALDRSRYTKPSEARRLKTEKEIRRRNKARFLELKEVN